MTDWIYKCECLYTVQTPPSAELWLANTNSAMEDMLVVIFLLWL